MSQEQDTELGEAVVEVVETLAYEIAEMIADNFGRSVIDSDIDLATQIIARLVGAAPNHDNDPVNRDPDWYIAQQAEDRVWNWEGDQ